MTLSSEANSSPPLPGNGLSNTWTTTVRMLAAADVALYVRPAGGGEAPVASSEYAVALIDGGDGGCVVTYPLDSRRVPAGDVVLIRREPDYLQPVGLRNQGRFDPHIAEKAWDRVTMLCQDLKDRLSKTIRIGFSQTFNTVAPVDGQPLKWKLNVDGSWTLASGEIEGIIPASQRVLYAQDLDLRGDGTDETDQLNAQMLAYSLTGGAVIYLKAPSGSWVFNGAVLIRTGINLTFGSPIKLGRSGTLHMAGAHALDDALGSIAADVFAGATTIPIADLESISASYAVGDVVQLGSGGERRTISGIDDEAGEITIYTATTRDLVTGATLRKVVTARLTADIAFESGATSIAVDNPGRFQIGDFVWLSDDETVSGQIVNSEQAIVTGTTGTAVTVDRPIRHPFAVAQNARLYKIDAVRSASLAGATIEFTEAPTAARVDTIQTTFAYRCRISDCAVPNADNFGSRGWAFRRYRSLEVEIVDCWAGPAKYTGSGEGYAFGLRESTGCKTKRCQGIGSRHVLTYQGCTDCRADELDGRLWTVGLVDFHGLREIGCHSYDVTGQGGDLPNQVGVKLGNPTYAAGCFDCTVQGGTIDGMSGGNSKCIEVDAPSGGLSVLDVVFRRAKYGIYAKNRADAPTLEVGRLFVRCDFYGVEVVGLIDMNGFGGTGRPFNQLDLTGSNFHGWTTGLHADNLDKLVMKDFTMRTTVAAAGGFAIDVQSITECQIGSGVFDGCQKLVQFEATPVDLTRYDVVNPGSAVVLAEVGSSSAGWRDAYGFYPASFVPTRTVASAGTIYSLPGME